MPIRKKTKLQTERPTYERVLAMEWNPSDWQREREALFSQIRAELQKLNKSGLSSSQQDDLLNISVQLADILIDLPVDWVGSDTGPKELRERVCDLVAILLIKQGWNEDLIRDITDRIYDIVQDSPFGRYVP